MKLTDLYKTRKLSELYGCIFVDFVRNKVIEYDDLCHSHIVKTWPIEEFKKYCDGFEDDLSLIPINTYKSRPKICRHTHTVSVSHEMVGGGVVEMIRNCVNCGLNLNPEGESGGKQK